MGMTSDAQQSRDAHLRQAFEKHLPRRIASIQRRTHALCDGGWDINTLQLIYNEVQQLAGSAGSYNLVDASEKLFALEVYLSSFTESGLIPDADKTAEIRSLLGDLDELSGGVDTGTAQARPGHRMTATVVSTAELPEPVIELNGLPSVTNVPRMMVPPLDFLPFDHWPESPLGAFSEAEPSAEDEADTDSDDYFDPDIERLMTEADDISIGDMADRIVHDESQLNVTETEDVGESWQEDLEELTDEALDGLLEEEPTPEAETRIETVRDEPETDATAPASRSEGTRKATLSKARTVYFLRRSEPAGDALIARLEPEYEVHSFDEVEEFREILGALGPDVIMIDGEFMGEIEKLGPLVKKIRQKQSGPMPMIVFSNDTDVATRLKILRAGADAFFKAGAPAEQIRQRLAELLQTQSEDPYRVMIVEDDRSQALFAKSILKKAGMEVFLERNPLKIMESLEAARPDLILMDLYMPDCDGIELTSIIREREDFINTPIVFLSGEDDTDRHFEALLAGGDDFLSKPIRPRHLIQAVTNRVQRARLLARRGVGNPRDSVTGLVSRQVLLERINALLADMDKIDPDLPGGVIYLELDDPFEMRRKIGLNAFEDVVSMLAPLLTQELGQGEVAARYGDNAYCILIPNRSLASVEALARDLVTRVSKHIFELEESSCTVSISAGLCALSSQLADAGATIADAERACSEAGSGQSRVGVARTGESQFDIDVDTGEAHLVELIEAAVEKRRFQVLFQPIVSLQGDHEEQYQALLRLPDEEGRPIAASEFIPVAEQSELILKVDRWIVSRALSVIDERSRKGRPLRLFINQSGASADHGENLVWLSKLIETRGIDGKHLVLEFKLPDILQRIKAMATLSTSLRELGVQMALGGFDGSDNAFQMLEHLKVTYVKLPPGAGREQIGARDLSEVIERLHKLGKLVIIPSIEDARTAAKLWPSGVDFIQGNFVQPPDSSLGYQF